MRVLIVVALMSSMFAGCLSPSAPGDDQQLVQPDLPLPLWRGDVLEMDVPVPVLLIGFSAEAAGTLAGALADGERVVQQTSTLNQPIPPDPDGEVADHMPLEGETIPMPIVPTARYEVVRLLDLADALAEAADDWVVDGRLEGRFLEAWLAERLAGTANEPSPATPSLVLVHESVAGGDWRYTFPRGWLEPVRSFGELEPMHIRVVGDGDHEGLVRELTHYRFLQGSVYPMPINECHAITLITAYRPTSLGEHLPGLERAIDLFRPEELAGAFRNLTGTTVHVDHKVLELPVDDPVLDLIVRGEFGTMEAQRAWFSMNWQDYWVAHEGCEAYLSFVIHGDLASAGSGIIGIGTYDGQGYRIALSWVNEGFRLLWDPASPVNQMGDESGEYNWIDFLHGHEAGHILGMHHPFHILRDGVRSNTAFQDVWSVMSYSTDGRVTDFGKIDQANFQRNSAAFLVAEAARLGLEGSPEWQAAMERMARYDWNGASAELWPSVEALLAGGSGDDGGEGLRMAAKPVHNLRS